MSASRFKPKDFRSDGYIPTGGVCGIFPNCPLYIASHEGGGFGCVDDMALPCRVSRGVMDFNSGVAAYMKHKAKDASAEWLRDMPTVGRS